MATVELITLTDSLDERIKNGVETVTFFHPVFGTKHEIELSEKNREHFAAHLAKLDKYIDASREVVAPVTTAPATKAGPKSDLAKVREWARANGFEVGDRGRIKSDILEAYDAAHIPTAVADNQVVLIVSPEAQTKLEEIADDKNAEPVKLVQVSNEAPESEQRELTDEEILNLMGNLDQAGEDVTLDKLAQAAKV